MFSWFGNRNESNTNESNTNDEQENIQSNRKEPMDCYRNILSLSKEITSNGNYSIRIGNISTLLPYFIDKQWDYQRKLDTVHVKQLMESIKKERYLHGVINLAILKDKINIVDGQHRIEALRQLYELGILDPNIQIIFEIIMCLSNKEILEYFKRVNLSKPLDEFDIIGNNHLDYMDRLKELFEENFGESLRDTENCLAPFNNFKKIKEYMMDNEIHKNISCEDLIDCFKRYNENQKTIIEVRYKMLGSKIRDLKTSSADRAKFRRQAKICEDMKKIKCYFRYEQSYEWITEAIKLLN